MNESLFIRAVKISKYFDSILQEDKDVDSIYNSNKAEIEKNIKLNLPNWIQGKPKESLLL